MKVSHRDLDIAATMVKRLTIDCCKTENQLISLSYLLLKQNLDCFTNNIGYSGGDIKGYQPRKVHSVFACQDLCQMTSGCRFFTVNSEGSGSYYRWICYLKGGPESWERFEHYSRLISGPRNCGELMCLVSIHFKFSVFNVS